MGFHLKVYRTDYKVPPQDFELDRDSILGIYSSYGASYINYSTSHHPLSRTTATLQELPGQNYSDSVAMTIAREFGLLYHTLI